MKDLPRPVRLLLNIGHGLDHMFLLVFASAVGAIAQDFGLQSWESLMPYGAGAFVLFGLGSIPAGRLGDLWGRRRMMIIFFAGLGASALLVAMTHSPWQIAIALVLLGAFASIYHPVGIPLLVQQASNPGFTIGINGLAGNLGVALAAVVTGFLVKWLGWRAAFALPAVFCLVCAVWFAYSCPAESEAPARRKGGKAIALPPGVLARAMLVMTVSAASGSILFNFTTNGNAQLISERFAGVVQDPATLGLLLGAIYAIASVAQVIVGKLLDHFEIKPIFLGIVVLQIPMLLLASYLEGWGFFFALMGVMIFIFGAVPFIDVVIVRYVDDHMRSRVAGIRLAVSMGLSSLAVWSLGPAVRDLGFATLFQCMGALAVFSAIVVSLLPAQPKPA